MSTLRDAIRNKRGVQSPYNSVPSVPAYSPEESLPTFVKKIVEQVTTEHFSVIYLDMLRELKSLIQEAISERLEELRGDPGKDADEEEVALRAAALIPPIDEVGIAAAITRVVTRRLPTAEEIAKKAAILVSLPDFRAIEERIVKKIPQPTVLPAPETPEQLVSKVLQIDKPFAIKDIRGLEEYLQNIQRMFRESIRKGDQPRMIHGGGITIAYGSSIPAKVTFIYDENVAEGAGGTAFTLDHTPIAGSVRLHRGGSRITVANSDYTISGATITLTTTLSAGEALTADYAY